MSFCIIFFAAFFLKDKIISEMPPLLGEKYTNMNY